MSRKRQFRFPEADVEKILELLRTGTRAVIKSWGRGDRAYVWRDGSFYLEETEEGALHTEQTVTEAELRGAMARRPEVFLPLIPKPMN